MPADKITRTIIQASPGWFVVRFIRGGNEDGKTQDDYLSYEEVIAWSIEICEHAEPRDRPISGLCSYDCIPLTVGGAADISNNPWALKSPQNRFDILHVGWYENEKEV